MAEDGRKRTKKAVWLSALGVFIAVAWVFGAPIVHLLIDAKRAGFFDKVKQHEYEGTSMENMKALYQALQLYYESEDEMPMASGWMDASKMYVRTNDLKKGEEMKKFINPRIPPGKGVYGYAYNVTMSQVYLDEVADPAQTPLVFESKDTEWNAFGEPAKLEPEPELPGGNKAVTAEGAVKALKDLLHPEKK